MVLEEVREELAIDFQGDLAKFLWESQTYHLSLKCTSDLAEISTRVCLFLILASFDMWAELYLNLQPSGSALIPVSIEY